MTIKYVDSNGHVIISEAGKNNVINLCEEMENITSLQEGLNKIGECEQDIIDIDGEAKKQFLENYVNEKSKKKTQSEIRIINVDSRIGKIELIADKEICKDVKPAERVCTPSMQETIHKACSTMSYNNAADFLNDLLYSRRIKSSISLLLTTPKTSHRPGRYEEHLWRREYK